jgi:hypothetical protein
MIALLLVTLATVSTSYCGEIEGIHFADQVTAEGKKLQLNGAGLHKATLFKIRAVAASLYAEKRSSNASEILNSTQVRKLVLQFQRDLSGERIANAWIDQIKSAFEQQSHATLDSRLDQLKVLLEDMSKGESIELTFLFDRVDFTIRGKAKGAISGTDFARALLGVWLGPNPINRQLKDALLGQ